MERFIYPGYVSLEQCIARGCAKADWKRQKMLASNYSFGIERDEEKLKANNLDFTKWTNPLEIQWVLFCAPCASLLTRYVGSRTRHP